MKISGGEILAQALKRQGVNDFFFLMGGPMTGAEGNIIDAGIRGIDVRHEQAAAMMAHAYCRVKNAPAVCVAASGPGTMNLVSGVANAFIDGAPVVALGGSSSLRRDGLGAFQELDQVSIMRPITRWAARAYDIRRIPELVDRAFRESFIGRPGPTYLDLPADIIQGTCEDTDVAWQHSTFPLGGRQRVAADKAYVDRALDLIGKAQRPIVLFGSGVLWSGASQQLRMFVERSGIPFYATPQGRGAIPEDHALSFLEARTTAFKEADLVIVCGTRLNYVIGHARPPRFGADAKFIQIDIDGSELGRTRKVEVGIIGDMGAVLQQLVDQDKGSLSPTRHQAWIEHLSEASAAKSRQLEVALNSNAVPIHPARLCKEIRDQLPRDAYLVVDGAQILDWGRQAIPSFMPTHRMNSGTFGTMGVGLPYAIGAKVAAPDKTVLVLHGDGSFGINGFEMDTALRHKIPVTCVVSNNGGWTSADNFDTDGVTPVKNKAGRDLGFTRYDLMFAAIGCYADFVEKPDQLAPAINRAIASNKPAVVNVITDATVRARGPAAGRPSNR